MEPAVQEEFPGLFGFTGKDEGMGAGAVFGGVLRGGGAAFGGRGAGAAGVAFFGFGVPLHGGGEGREIFGFAHLLSDLSVEGGRTVLMKKTLQVAEEGRG